jgi:hypothetical protein
MARLLTFVAVVALALATLAGSAQARAQGDPGAGRTFTIPLSGPGGSGTAIFTFNPGLGLVCYTIDVTLTTPGDVPQEPGPGVGDAHIHGPTGAIAVNLHTQFQSLGGGMFVASGCVRADKTVVRQILADPSAYYVNVHTTTYPAGAVSGPLA